MEKGEINEGEKSDNKGKKTKTQIIGASLVMITGLFVMIAMANTITGGVTGKSSVNVSVSGIAIAFWGLLIISVGIWIMRRKDFNKSILDIKYPKN
jgi:hypothetical protein